MIKSLLKKWWFWVIVVLLIPVAWYMWGYVEWYAEGAKYRTQNAISNAYIADMEQERVAFEDAYKNDSYGGSTPEETLRLFIEALENKDYVGASNLFVPEKRKQYREDLIDAANTGGPASMISAYSTGNVKVEKYLNEEQYKIRLYPNKSTIPFVFEMIKNPFKDKWLIAEL